MPIPVNAFTRFPQIGTREDLTNVIYNISPEDTPGMSNAGRLTATNTLVQWQQDALAAANTANAQIDGNDAVGSVLTPTQIQTATCQISSKVPIVSERAIVVNTAGRSNEMSYQIAKAGAELKRDMEAIMFGSLNVSLTGNDTTAPTTAALPNWLKTNTSLGAGGVNAVYTTTPTAARTDGTQRVFTEALLKSAMVLGFQSGANPKILMVGPVNKQRTSGFAGIAALTAYVTGMKQATIYGAASVYIGDFGTVTVVPNRFQRERDAFLLDPDYYAVAYLRPFKTTTIAPTGDAQKRLLLVDYALQVGTEKAHAAIFDLTTT